jgi:hypothetical protein
MMQECQALHNNSKQRHALLHVFAPVANSRHPVLFAFMLLQVCPCMGCWKRPPAAGQARLRERPAAALHAGHAHDGEFVHEASSRGHMLHYLACITTCRRVVKDCA